MLMPELVPTAIAFTVASTVLRYSAATMLLISAVRFVFVILQFVSTAHSSLFPSSHLLEIACLQLVPQLF